MLGAQSMPGNAGLGLGLGLGHILARRRPDTFKRGAARAHLSAAPPGHIVLVGLGGCGEHLEKVPVGFGGAPAGFGVGSVGLGGVSMGPGGFWGGCDPMGCPPQSPNPRLT